MRSQTDPRTASTITGLSEKELARLHGTLVEGAGRAFLPAELEMFAAVMGAMRKLTFVQIGANDGVTHDPIHHLLIRYADTALLVEPQPWLIPALKKNYSKFGGKLIVENMAIGASGGTLDLFVLKDKYHQEFITKVGRNPTVLASPDINQIVKRIAPRLGLSEDVTAAEYIEKISVASLPLGQLLARHGLAYVDVLQVDCEGYDVQVITSLGDVLPVIINFESLNLSKEDWKLFLDWSRQQGYGFIQGRKDTLAIRGFPHRIEL
jgi:FkbM family methyltransferase